MAAALPSAPSSSETLPERLFEPLEGRFLRPQAPGRARSELLTQYERQVEAADVNQQVLQNIFSAPQMRPSHPAAVIQMSEAAFAPLGSPSQYALPARPSNPSPIGIARFPRLRLASPSSSPHRHKIIVP